MKARFSKDELSHIFNKFVGTEIKTEHDLKPIKAEAKKHGLHLFPCYPDSFRTDDIQSSTLNIYIEKDTENKWCIKNKFHLG